MHEKDNDNNWQENTYITNLSGEVRRAVLFQNMRSLRQNYSKLKDLIVDPSSQPAVIGMSEIWQPLPHQYNLVGYQKLVRVERPGPPNKGGGLGFYIRNDIEYETINTVFKEQICETLAIRLPSIKTIILNCYRSPNPKSNNPNIPDPKQPLPNEPDSDSDSDSDSNAATSASIIFINKLREQVLKLEHNYKGSRILIGGDFNINLLNLACETAEKLTDTLQDLGFISLINSPTRVTCNSSTAIDLIFSNDTSLTGRIAVTDISDHMATLCDILPEDNPSDRHIWVRSINKKTLAKLNESLGDTNWNFDYTTDNTRKNYTTYI